ncbi:TetR/AcrR family transcriptional regulator [Nocardioides mangrovicus]|uniref:TetR/AcrR family transcriptional regulator n=2 Tax=Nocardioides mangrovicus TaxID=2478913 RepID=A0A3L8NYP4_9ACTN|nr:TetR/AcrR family transcriptional regulator [Nocardioides mangrovicus]
MKPEERRALVLDAGVRAFARTGYAGTSTDAVAKEAGVSQPYVVRIFGTKLDLFCAVFDQVMGRIVGAFREEIESGPFTADSEDDWGRLGMRYTELVVDRDLLLVMMHGIVASAEPAIGTIARARMGEVFEVLRRTGADDERIRDFIGYGMLLNVMLAMRAPEFLGEKPGLSELTRCAFGDALPLLTDG